MMLTTSNQKERSMLFSAPMVRALLDGSKTQTRRILKPQPPAECGIHYMLGNESWLDEKDRTPLRHHWEAWGGPLYKSRPVGHLAGTHTVNHPYGQPGDRLYVRETFMDLTGTGVEHRDDSGKMKRFAYAAEFPSGSHGDEARKAYKLKWKPSIHMPRAASRILLEIVSVRVERLNEISEADAKAEGAKFHDPANHLSHGGWSHDEWHVHPTATGSFEKLWSGINGADSWAANPWVWCLTFKRVQ